MVKQFGGGICSLCGSKNSTKTTCPLNKEAKNPSPSKHYNAHSTTATPKSTGLTVDDYVDRMHSDMMRDFHYPSLPSGEFYIIHFTDKEIDDFIDKMLIAGKKNNVSFIIKTEQLKDIFSNQRIYTAILKINTLKMPLHWKLFFKLCKNKNYTIILLLTLFMIRFRNIKTKI